MVAIGIGCADSGGLPSFAPRALAAARATAKPSLEEAALRMAFVVGYRVRRSALLLLFFYFHTGANKLMDFIADLKMALGELLINVIAGISVPNEPRDFYEKLTTCSKSWIASLQEGPKCRCN